MRADENFFPVALLVHNLDPHPLVTLLFYGSKLQKITNLEAVTLGQK
jgi:hypothetical protein